MSDPASAPPAPRRPVRAIASWVVLVLAAVFLLLTAFAVWIDRVALNTDVFEDTSSALIEDDAIRHAVATRAVDELFTNVDVETELKAQLPADYKSLSGPAAAGLREASYTLVARALEQPRFQQLWSTALSESHRTLVEVLEGDGDTVATEGGVVTLDLETIVLEASDRIGIRDRVEDQLPEDVGNIEILRSDDLDTAQDTFSILNALAWVIPLLTIALFALAVWLAGDRRRAVRRIGVAMLLVGVLGLVAANLAGNYLVNELVSDTESRTAAGNAWEIVTVLLRDSFRTMVAIGILILVAAWLAGPGRRAVGARRFAAPAVRNRVWAYGALGVLGLVLLFVGNVTDFVRFLLVLLLVALGAVWIEAMRRQTLREFPDATGPDVIDEARSRLSAWWKDARERTTQMRVPATAPAAPAGGSDLTSSLATLADLHARGELTDDEYAAAKARVLGGE